jgi:type III restriction enzyme
MTHLFQTLAAQVDGWREAGYPCPAYPALREVLEFAADEQSVGQLRFLRTAQFRALETY